MTVEAPEEQIARLERENAKLVDRIVRLRQAVQGLAADAAHARREAAALRRSSTHRHDSPKDGSCAR